MIAAVTFTGLAVLAAVADWPRLARPLDRIADRIKGDA